MNRTGKRDNFLAFDLAQEENIADIKVSTFSARMVALPLTDNKVNYRSMGPGATMEYMQKVSPAIPTLRKIQCHMESQFQTFTRRAHHGVPDKENDVVTLTSQYVKSGLHINAPGRKLKGGSSDKAADFVTLGAINLQRLPTVKDWFTRRSHERSTREDFGEEESDLILLL
jgi:hypothetical protein